MSIFDVLVEQAVSKNTEYPPLRTKGEWARGELIDLFNEMIPNFNHKETGKFLDGRM